MVRTSGRGNILGSALNSALTPSISVIRLSSYSYAGRPRMRASAQRGLPRMWLITITECDWVCVRGGRRVRADRLFTWRMLLDCGVGKAQIISSALQKSRETLLCGGRPDRMLRPGCCLDVDVDVGALRLR